MAAAVKLSKRARHAGTNLLMGSKNFKAKIVPPELILWGSNFNVTGPSIVVIALPTHGSGCHLLSGNQTIG